MQIIRRSRLGNDTEDITFFPARVRPGVVAVMDGYDVLGLTPDAPPLVKPPVPGLPSPVVQTAAAPAVVGPIIRPSQKLFDVLGLKIKVSPRGITHVDPKGLFVFNDPSQPSLLFVTDDRGVTRDSIALQYPDGEPAFIEGLAYIPAQTREFPDTLVMVTSFTGDAFPTGLQARLSIINFSGEVVRQIIPQGDLSGVYLTGVAFQSPDRLLVSSDDDEVINALDFNGKVIASYQGPGSVLRLPAQPVLHGIEGLAQLPTGQVAAAGGFDGTLAILNLTGEVTKPEFIDYRIGIGLSSPSGLAWDSTSNRFLAIGIERVRPDARFIFAVAPTLDSFQPVVTADPLTRKVAYLPDEQLIAATHTNNPRGILLFSQGKQVGQIDTSQLSNSPPVGLSYIPTMREFVVVFRAQQSKLSLLTRDGALARTIDLAPKGIKAISAVTFFNPSHASGGQFLVFDNTQDLLAVTDFNGVKMATFSIRDTLRVLNPTAVTTITSGLDTGAFAIANPENSEIVIFRLD